MIGIIDWRMAQCETRGVEFRFNTWADADTVLADKPDVVIVATGGLPHTEVLRGGQRAGRLGLGHPLGRREARRQRAGLRRCGRPRRRCRPPR